MKTFEEFLQDIFNENSFEILDDDLPDAFDSWLGDLDGKDYIKFADKYGNYVSKETALNIINEVTIKYTKD